MTAGGTTLERMARADNYNAWLLERSRPLLGRRVLDAGAGIGTFTGVLATHCDEVVALEPDPPSAASLRARFAAVPRVSVAEADLAELEPAALGPPFDSVVCFNVLEHVEDDERALRNVRELLAADGRVFLLVPAHEALRGSIDRTVGHHRRYSRRTLRAKVSAAGLELETLRAVNPVGALGWFAAARILRSADVPAGPLSVFDRLVPILRRLDHVELPFGLSLWAIARRVG